MLISCAQLLKAQRLVAVLCIVDPNTLNLYPDPEFWPNLDPDPGKKIIIIKTLYRKTSCFKKSVFNYNKIMSPEEIVCPLSF